MNAQAILDGTYPLPESARRPTNPFTPTVTMKEPGPNDLYIAIMGLTGSGKSTFISRCADQGQRVEIGHGLKSQPIDTSEIAMFTLHYLDKTIHLIDTPGFDDTFRRDIDILKDVSYWLNKSYTQQNIELTGIVYLHRITDTRFGGTARKDLQMFKKLCGEDSFSHVVLATTMWESVSKDDGDRRESQLATSEEFYGSMIQMKATMFRHEDNRNSAMNIITHLVNKKTTVVLSIQREMAKEGLSLDETEAGRELDSEMIKERARFQKMLKNNRADLEAAIEKRDNEQARFLAEEQDKLKQKIADAEKSRDQLKIDMEALFEEKDRQFKQAMEKFDMERKEREREMQVKAEELEELKKQIKEAEVTMTKKKAEQEAAIEKHKEELERANGDTLLVLQAAIVMDAMNEQELEENNRRIEENIARAKAEQQRQENELARARAAEMAALQNMSRMPQYYTGSPPPYAQYSQYSQNPQYTQYSQNPQYSQYPQSSQYSQYPQSSQYSHFSQYSQNPWANTNPSYSRSSASTAAMMGLAGATTAAMMCSIM